MRNSCSPPPSALSHSVRTRSIPRSASTTSAAVSKASRRTESSRSRNRPYGTVPLSAANTVSVHLPAIAVLPVGRGRRLAEQVVLVGGEHLGELLEGDVDVVVGG